MDVVALQREIHASGQENPYKSGQLARLLNVPASHCAWETDSWQYHAFHAGYLSIASDDGDLKASPTVAALSAVTR